MSLGKTLKALRQKKSLNQKDLSSLSGVSQATSRASKQAACTSCALLH